MRVAIAGSSGLVGTALRARLGAAGHDVVPVVRRRATAGEIGWDPSPGHFAPAAFAGVGAVVNLAGAGIGDRRWTADYKRTLLEGRVQITGALAAALAEAHRRGAGPSVLLSGSAVGVYGDGGGRLLDETSPAGSDFLAGVCTAWEAATAPAAVAGVRVAHLRSGMVLARQGGALRRLLPLYRFGLGGRMGRGTQWISWISIDDEVGAIEHLLTSETSGPVNLTAPVPVTNAEFARTLGRVLHRPAVMRIPAFGPKLVLGAELAQSLLFDGQRALPRVLQGDGYAFAHPTLEDALRAILQR